jgi:DNA-binding response OmpR family regulator
VRALLVEDDPDIVELVQHYLEQDGWTVESVADGRRAVERVRQGGLELLVLDLQLPGMDGLSVCGEVRRLHGTRELPILILTARSDEADRVLGLELGADDYVVKPFSPKELMARVRAVRRRLQSAELPQVLSAGPLDVDPARHVVRWAGEPASLTAKEFALLVALLEARGRVLSRKALLEQVWGYSYADGTRTVDVHVRRLREKIPGLASWIVTVKSVGYRLEVPAP